MTPALTKQFDAATYDPQWHEDDILELDDQDDQDDDFVTHMKFECRQGRFV